MWDLDAEALCLFQLTCRILPQGLSEMQALIKISVKGDCHPAFGVSGLIPSAYPSSEPQLWWALPWGLRFTSCQQHLPQMPSDACCIFPTLRESMCEGGLKETLDQRGYFPPPRWTVLEGAFRVPSPTTETFKTLPHLGFYPSLYHSPCSLPPVYRIAF